MMEHLFKDKRHLATLALIVGFLVDVVTFRNLNLEIALIVLAAHLIIVAGTTLIGAGGWFSILQQYSTGNLLSAFLVLYSASGSLAASWPFLALVLVAAVGNEVIHDEKNRFPFQTSLLFLNLVLFMALAIPLTFGAIGLMPFVASLAIAWVVFSAYLWFGRLVIKEAFRARWLLLRGTALGIAALILFLYFTNVIPPIPLSVKDAGFYHSVARVNGNYAVQDEVRPWYERFLDLGGVALHLPRGGNAYFYSAVFAPARLDTNIVHHWQHLDPVSGEWITTNTVEFPISGGRRAGYRGYSIAGAPAPGRWRVSVETTRGQVLTRAYLTVERAAEPPALSEIILR